MNLVKFVDNRFQECRLKQSAEEARKEYCVATDAEAQATVTVLSAYRTLVKWFMVPKVVFHFILVSMGLLRPPRPVLIEKLEADQLKSLQEKSRKLGMLDKVAGASTENVSNIKK